MVQNPAWKITAMLAKVPPCDYLPEARRFEQDAIAAGTLSDDWRKEWHDHCQRRMMRDFEGRKTPAPVVTSLFGDL